MPRPNTHSTSQVRISGLGCGAAFLVIMITAAAMNTGTNLLYLMLSALLSFWTLTFFSGWMNLRGIEVQRRLPAEAHARQQTHIEYEIYNSKTRLAVMGLTLRDVVESPARPPVSVHFIAIPATGRARQSAEFRPHRRGLIRFSRLGVTSSFPFGFLDFYRTLEIPDELLVYPELIPVRPVVLTRTLELGMRDSKVKGAGSNLYAIRDYAPGDPARAIHWRLSAKGMGVKVREHEREESRRIRVVLDYPIRTNAGVEELKGFERAVSAAAALADYFIRHGVEVSLWSPGGGVPPGSGRQQWRLIMKTLAMIDPKDWRLEGGGVPNPPPPGEFVNISVTPDTLDDICDPVREFVA